MAGNFYGVVTRTGHGLITAALASGTRVNLTHIALGDGGGAAVAPSEEMQALVNEVHRAPINTLAQDPANAALIWAEVVLPANVGGWYIREAGILDEEGNLVAVAGTPESYKPALAEGSGSEFVLRLPLVLTNTESVILKIDPTVVLASREHVAVAVAEHNAAADAHADIRAEAQAGSDHADRRDNPHVVTAVQVEAVPLSGKADLTGGYSMAPLDLGINIDGTVVIALDERNHQKITVDNASAVFADPADLSHWPGGEVRLWLTMAEGSAIVGKGSHIEELWGSFALLRAGSTYLVHLLGRGDGLVFAYIDEVA
ncbi:phage tail protein [Desulfocurvus sp. DL9XJH121]